METEHKKKLKARMEQENKKWVAIVTNTDEKAVPIVETQFTSEKHAIENILHKIELDLMTNLHHGLKSPIGVAIAELK